MDFNDIQKQWNNEKTDNVVIPTNLKKIEAANTPLDKIRKNLKKEFFYQILSIVFTGFVPLIYDFPKELIPLFYLFFSLFLAICVYYLVKLYLFYVRISAITMKTKDNLYETYFDIRLNMELYKTFGFALIPFIILSLIGFLYYKFSKAPAFLTSEITNFQMIGVFSIVVFSFLSMGIALEVWVNRFYGKYAKQIRQVLDELKEE